MNACDVNTPASDEIDVAIVGGGLSGLVTAHHLYESKADSQVFEAASRLGGRIATAYDQGTGQYAGDLGATWVWPAYQPHIASGLKRLKLITYHQYEKGNGVLDMQLDQPPLQQFLPAQHGIARIVGGPQAIIDALIARLPGEKLNTNCAVDEIRKVGNKFSLHFNDAEKATILAKFIVIAIPIRLAAQTIAWNNLLDSNIISIMHNTPTWMATQTKVLLGYTHAFWRTQGFSGRVVSQIGPMAEIHDHCGKDGQPAALFGFVSWSAKQRREIDLKAAVKTQVIRCFGPEAAQFTHLTIKDWASDHSICSQLDLAEPPAHPSLINDLTRQGHSDDRIFFATAETARHSPGLLDGAFEAGARAAKQIALKIKT